MLGCILLAWLLSAAMGSPTASLRKLRLRAKRPLEPDQRGEKLINEPDATSYDNADTISPEAMAKCYAAIDEAAVNGQMCLAQYIDFLSALSGKEYSSISEVPSIFVIVFYATACSSGQDCVNNTPVITVDSSSMHRSLLDFMCDEALTYTSTHVNVRFEFSIRYNSSAIPSEKITDCLNAATENLLLEHFGCNEPRRLSKDQAYLNERLYALVENRHRRLNLHQDPVIPGSTYIRNNCAYSATSDSNVLSLRKYLTYVTNSLSTLLMVHALLSAACVPPISDPSIECGLVQAAVDVTAQLKVEPDPMAFEAEVIQVLRVAIDSGTLESFLPVDCQPLET